MFGTLAHDKPSPLLPVKTKQPRSARTAGVDMTQLCCSCKGCRLDAAR